MQKLSKLYTFVGHSCLELQQEPVKRALIVIKLANSNQIQ